MDEYSSWLGLDSVQDPNQMLMQQPLPVPLAPQQQQLPPMKKAQGMAPALPNTPSWEMLAAHQDENAANPEDDFRTQFLSDLQKKRQTIQDNQSRLADLENKPASFDNANLRPLLAWADSLNGTQSAQYYEKPKDKSQELKEKLIAQIDKGESGLSNAQVAYLRNIATNDLAKQKADANVDQQTWRRDYLNKKLMQGDDRLAVSTGQNIDNDATLIDLGNRRLQIGRDVHTLENSPVLTPQVFDEIQKGVANAITGAKSATVSDTAALKIKTLDQDYANFMQRVSSNPQDINNPQLKSYLSGLLHRLDDAYIQNIKDRTSQKVAGLSHLSSSKAKAVVNSKVDQFNAPLASGAGAPASGLITVSNGSTTFTVKPENLQQAIKEGYQEVK